MRKLFLILLLLFSFLFTAQTVSPKVISGGVSVSDTVPVGFFGAWSVAAVRVNTTNEQLFVPYSVEMWNLSKTGDVITLENPVSGAVATVTVQDTTENTFTFKRETTDVGEKVEETVKLTLSGDNFYGFDTMVVRYYKNGSVIKEETVNYKLKAKKVSGENIWKIFGVNSY